MRFNKRTFLTPLFLAALLVLPLSFVFLPPNIVGADELDNFNYDPVFWENWELDSGEYYWNQQNSTLQVQGISTGAASESSITRLFDMDDDENSLELDYFYRYTNLTSPTAVVWWNTSFPYRKSHTLTGSSVAGAQTNYQIRLVTHYGAGADSGNSIYLDSLSQTDFDDLRFIKSDHVTEFDYWRQEYTLSNQATFWVEVDSVAGSGATTEIFLYWGNASASTHSNGENTFILYDDFNDGKIDWNKWVWQNGTYGGVPVENDGLLMLNDTTDRTLVSSLANYTPNVAVHGEIYFRDYRSFGFVEYVPNWNDDTITVGDYGATERSMSANEGSQTNVNYGQAEQTWQIMSTKWFSSSRGATEVNYVSATNHTTDIPDGTPNIPVFFYTYHGDANELLHLNWTIVCKVVYSEPRSTATGTLSVYSGGECATYGYVKVNYSTLAATQELGLYHNDSFLWIEYYNWSSQQSFIYFNITALNFNYEEYVTVSWEVDAYTRTAALEVTLINGTELIDAYVFVDFNPARAESVSVGAYADRGKVVYANSTIELVWMEAPFSDVRFVRDWDTVNFEDDDSPYFIHTTTIEWENASVKVMPFQGFKALWNTSLAGEDDPMLIFDWYSRNGTYQGGFMFLCNKLTPYDFYIYTSPDGSVWTLRDIFKTDSWTVAVALWMDEGGKAYAYLQEDPESHTFCEFLVYDITDYVDLDSWGVQFTHCLKDTTGGSIYGDVFTALKEAEIFAGEKVGISQPRFGGMVWLWNPFLVLFHWLASMFQGFVIWLASALAPVIAGLGTFLRPIIEATTAAVAGLVGWLSDQLDILTTIWGVISSIVTDIATEFVTEFITPLVTALATWILTNLIPAILQGLVIVQSLFLWVMGVISLWFFGDATLLPNAFVGFYLLIASIIYALLSFLVSGNILMLGYYLVGFMSGNAGPIGFTFGTVTGFGEMGILVMYWAVTFGPYILILYLLLTLLRCMTQFLGDYDVNAFAPMFDIFKIIMWLANIVWVIVRTSATMIWSFVTAVMELIPF